MLRALALACLALASSARAAALWMVLPPTPRLPKATISAWTPVDSVRLWYAEFGHGQPVLLLHGGLANADYWGNQVRALMRHYRVIVMDSRGHGRSSRNAQPFGYDLMAEDVVGLPNYLKLKRVALVGWNDGAIIGLDIAMRHPERLTKLFAFAANYDTQGVADIVHSPVFAAFEARAGTEYARLSPTPHNYRSFLAAITAMWAHEPNWHEADFRRISVPTWIVDADHDEAITPDQPRTMASWIPSAGLLVQPDVSHFSFIQDPEQFDRDVEHFLKVR
ncbi:MAG TPA: alpha/beta hydrolase [Rhizomicrobium sp.]|nr:alpha/beta hydrolase [Rhizomicrobium sp.]